MKLCEMKAGQRGSICGLQGPERFLGRITAVGITVGCPIVVMQNRKKSPILVNARDSAIALDRSDCNLIDVEVAL